MDHTYWSKQTADKPLFPELLWSRPENKAHAGKLLIIGGNQWGFAAPGLGYDEALKAGVGSARVLLPAAVHKLIGHVLEHADSAPSNPSGSFSQKALADFLEQAAWADGVLLAGDLGRNSETAIVIEQFIHKYGGQLTLTKDAVEYAIHIAPEIIKRPNTTLVLSLGQLQKLAVAARFDQAITSSMDLIRLVDVMHTFTEHFSVNIVLKHYQTLIVAASGRVTSTKLIEDKAIWRVTTAAHAAVWWLQNPARTLEALTTALIAIDHANDISQK